MNYIDLGEFISAGEDVSKEFKPNLKNNRIDISNTMVAYANDLSWVGGGYIYIGIDNECNICGLTEDFDDIQRGIAEICRDRISPPLTPHIKKIPLDGSSVCEVKIVRSLNRPHRSSQICYVRIGSTTRKATLDEEELIKQCSIVPSYDSQPLAKATADDIDWDAFKEYISSTKPSTIFETSDSISTIALNLGFLVKAGANLSPKIGTILLFGKSPCKYLPHSKVQAIKFKGLDCSAPIAARHSFEGTLPILIKSSRTFFENIASTASIFDSDSFHRVDYDEYPHLALREAIANAIFHRDYSESGKEIDIRVFDDRIEILSPGPLGGGLRIEDLGTGKRYIRNQLLSEVLNDMKFVERAGTGILRIQKEMERNGSPKPIFKSDHNSFLAILPAHPFYGSQRLLEEANDAKARANYDEARSMYLASLKFNPENYIALHNLADLEFQIGNRESAREHLRQCIKMQPSNPQAWLTLAILEEKLQNYEAAREVFKTAVQRVTKNSVVLRSWAILEWNQKNYEKADSLFQDAIQKDPQDFINWYKKGQMDINSPVERHKRNGEKCLRKAATLTQDPYILSDIHFLLARGMQSLKYSNMEIEENYKKSLDLNPNRGSAHHYYAVFLESIGRSEEAKEHFKTSKSLGYAQKHDGRRHLRRRQSSINTRGKS